MNRDDAVAKLQEKFGETLSKKTEFRGEISFFVYTDRFKDVCSFCKNVLGYDYLVDISGVDNFGDEPRFEVVYELYSMEGNHHLRLKTSVSEDDLEAAPTVSDLWPTANWHEREVFDMMGIRFAAHPDLRRILMWDGYPYFPLRKDFPLEGKPSDVPEVAFTGTAPLGGGPFVTSPTPGISRDREPRARRPLGAGDPSHQ